MRGPKITEDESAAQISSVALGHTTGQPYATLMFTVARKLRSCTAKRQAQEGWCRKLTIRDEDHIRTSV